MSLPGNKMISQVIRHASESGLNLSKRVVCVTPAKEKTIHL